MGGSSSKHTKNVPDPKNVKIQDDQQREYPYKLAWQVSVDFPDDPNFKNTSKQIVSDTFSYVTVGATPKSKIPICLPHVVGPGRWRFTTVFTASWGGDPDHAADSPPQFIWDAPWNPFTEYALQSANSNMHWMGVGTSVYAATLFSDNPYESYTPWLMTTKPFNPGATYTKNQAKFVVGKLDFIASFVGRNYAQTEWLMGDRGGRDPSGGSTNNTWYGIGPEYHVRGHNYKIKNTPYSVFTGNRQLIEAGQWKRMCEFDTDKYGSLNAGAADCDWFMTFEFYIDNPVISKLMDPWTDKALMGRFALNWPKPLYWDRDLGGGKKGFPSGTSREYVYSNTPFYFGSDIPDITSELRVSFTGAPNLNSKTMNEVNFGVAYPILAVVWSGSKPGHNAYLVQFVPDSMLDKTKKKIDPAKYDPGAVGKLFCPVPMVEFDNYDNVNLYRLRNYNFPGETNDGNPMSQVARRIWFQPRRFTGKGLLNVIQCRRVGSSIAGEPDFYLACGKAQYPVNFSGADHSIQEAGTWMHGNTQSFPFTDRGDVSYYPSQYNYKQNLYLVPVYAIYDGMRMDDDVEMTITLPAPGDSNWSIQTAPYTSEQIRWYWWLGNPSNKKNIPCGEPKPCKPPFATYGEFFAATDGNSCFPAHEWNPAPAKGDKEGDFLKDQQNFGSRDWWSGDDPSPSTKDIYWFKKQSFSIEEISLHQNAKQEQTVKANVKMEWLSLPDGRSAFLGILDLHITPDDWAEFTNRPWWGFAKVTVKKKNAKTSQTRFYNHMRFHRTPNYAGTPYKTLHAMFTQQKTLQWVRLPGVAKKFNISPDIKYLPLPKGSQLPLAIGDELIFYLPTALAKGSVNSVHHQIDPSNVRLEWECISEKFNFNVELGAFRGDFTSQKSQGNVVYRFPFGDIETARLISGQSGKFKIRIGEYPPIELAASFAELSPEETPLS